MRKLVDLLILLILPFQLFAWIVGGLFVAAYARLFWPHSDTLTGQPVRVISVGSSVSPVERMRQSLLAYHRQNSCWPDSFAQLDPYCVLETTQLSMIFWLQNENGSLDITWYLLAGKGAFKLEPPA